MSFQESALGLSTVKEFTGMSMKRITDYIFTASNKWDNWAVVVL